MLLSEFRTGVKAEPKLFFSGPPFLTVSVAKRACPSPSFTFAALAVFFSLMPQKIKDRTFTFTLLDAQRYGLNEAIFLQYLLFWIQKNEKKKIGFYDERYWTYFTYSRLCTKSLPFWKSRQRAMRVIKNLEEEGAIITRTITHHENGNRVFGGKAVAATLTDSYLASHGFSR